MPPSILRTDIEHTGDARLLELRECSFGTIWVTLRRLIRRSSRAKRRCQIIQLVGKRYISKMDFAYIPALAAFGGSAVGGLTTLVAAWATQRRNDSALRLAQERARRQKLYKKFIDEASKLYADALVHDKSEVSSLVNMYALIGKMRVLSSDEVIGQAEMAARMIIDTYFSPNKSFNELRQLLIDSNSMDPLREFGELCRKELIALR